MMVYVQTIKPLKDYKRIMDNLPSNKDTNKTNKISKDCYKYVSESMENLDRFMNHLVREFSVEVCILYTA